MRHTPILLLVLILFPASPVAWSQDAQPEGPVQKQKRPGKVGALDLIPADACGAIAVRNLADLKKKFEKLIKAAKMPATMPVSEGFTKMYDWLGVTNGLDENAAGAAMILRYRDALQSAVFAVPVADRDAMAGNFGLAGTDLQPGEVVKRKTKNKNRHWPWMSGVVLAEGRHVFLGSNAAALKYATGWKSLWQELAEPQRKLLDSSDVLFHISTKGWGKGWQDVLNHIDRRHAPEGDTPEARVYRDLRQALESLKLALVGLNLDGGIGINAVALFQQDELAQKVLTRLAGGSGSSDLRGLPRGKVVLAYAAKGDGTQNADLARALLQTVLKEFTPSKQFVSAARRPHLVGIFWEVWRRLRGSRSALFLNEDPQKHGLLSLVAILDTADAEQFLTEMKQLSVFVNNRGLKLSEAGDDGIDKATIQKLIGQLGDDDFCVRESATLKLALVGEPVLPFLEKALKSDDPEVAWRAKRIRSQVMAVAEESRKALLERDLLARLKPKFAYFPAVEKRLSRTVDVVNIRLQQSELPIAPQLKRFFGPDWDKIRVATHAKQVVVLLGSNTSLFETTLKNLQDGRPGLAAVEELAEFATRRDENRKVELHVSLGRMKSLLNPSKAATDQPAPAAALSSLALSITPHRIQVDLFVPYAELAARVRNWPK